MLRLAMAIAAALVLHILLLLIVVPEPQVEEPEIKGTGQVTVSIIRSAQQSDLLDEEQEQEVPSVPEENEIIREAPEMESVDTVQKPQVQEQVPERKEIQPTIEEVAEESVEKEVFQEVTNEVIQETDSIQTEEEKVTPYASDIESLQDPQPILNSNHPPVYPALARKRGWEGTVILEVDIRSDGMVKDIQIKNSSGFEMLDSEALRAVSKWKFLPGSRAGKFVDMKVFVPVQFTLMEQ